MSEESQEFDEQLRQELEEHKNNIHLSGTRDEGWISNRDPPSPSIKFRR